MQNSVAKVLALTVIACVCGAATALGAAETSPVVGSNGMFDALQRDMLVLKSRLSLMFSALPDLPDIGPFLVQRLTKQHDPEHIWMLGLQLAAVIVGGVLGELVARRMFRPMRRFLPSLDVRTEFGRLGALLLTAVIRVFELAAFLLVAISLFFAIYDGHQVARYAFWCVLSIIMLVRLISVGLRVLLAPKLPELRLPELDDRSARRLFRSLLSVAALVIAAGLLSTFLFEIGFAEPLHLALGFVLILVATSGLVGVIWGERRAITRLISGTPVDHAKPKDLGRLFAENWHVFATFVVVAISIAAFCERLVTGERQVAHVYATFGLLLGMLLLDGLVRMTVRSYFGAKSGAAEDGAAATADDAANAAYGAVILRNCRLALAVLAVVLIGRIWGVDAAALGSTGVGARVAEAVFQVVITLLLASAAWSVVKISINRHLPHEKRDALELATDEGSGSGLSRLETLLPLVRMFLFVTILAMALMSAVSAMGVNIGPLLAGAGIVGIAVGFGAQTLVRDVLSGIFFLFDDAFRIGEYIDVGDSKGTVERMSIRALILRHQLGHVYTVPFGAIRRVANYSRDWTIMKLEVRVPFHTDLERLRKVVKQVGAELKTDPEIGPMFLQPLKSQGVNRVDESAFVVRVKFMARPTGDAFILRRHVFRSIQEAFEKNGIDFAAHRVVVEGEDPRTGAAEITVLPTTGDRMSRA